LFFATNKYKERLAFWRLHYFMSIGSVFYIPTYQLKKQLL